MIGGAPSLTSMLDEEPGLQWRPMGSTPVNKSTAAPAGGSGPQHGPGALLNTAAVARRLSPVVPPKAVHPPFAWGAFIRLPFARMSPAPAPGVGRDEREAGFPELVLGALRSAFYRCMESYERHEGLGMT